MKRHAPETDGKRRPLAGAVQVNEEESNRNFGGCSPVPLPVRDIPANMRVTAKQIRYNGRPENKNRIQIEKEENLCVELSVIQAVKA